MSFVQLRLRAPDSLNNPAAIKRIDDSLKVFAACFKAPDGTLFQEQDGTWEVRVLVPMSASMVKLFLTDQGLEVVSEEEVE